MINQSVLAKLSYLLSIYQPKLPEFLERYSGRRIRLTYLDWSLCMQIHQSGFIEHHGESCAQITLNFEALLIGIGIKHPDAKISITGDKKLAQAFYQLLMQLDMNHKALLYDLLPTTIAWGVYEASRLNISLSKHILHSLKQQLSHYLVYESGLVINQEQAHTQYQDTLNLFYAIERLKQS